MLADFSMPQMNGDQLVNRLKQIAGHVPMILLGDPQTMSGQIHAADALLAKKNCSPQELLERIKVMSARKRGPRKGTLRHGAGSGTGRGVVEVQGPGRRLGSGSRCHANQILTRCEAQPFTSAAEVARWRSRSMGRPS